MGTAGEAECALEMEAMRKKDSSWHPCRVSFCSAEAGLLIEFGSQGLEDMLLHDEEALTCLRFRSAPLQGDDCTHIKEGECVLVTHKLQFKSNFYDAKVEKVVRVRHSKRVHCRCTFTIKWLHQDLEGETLTVPSSSIMKLATKSINVHPAVAVFLRSVKQMRSSCSSPSPTVLEETNGEMDLNYLLEKQIEEISNSVNASKEGISEDILLGVNGGNVDNKEHRQWNTVTVSKVSISHAQVPHDWNQLNRSIQKSREMQIELQVEGQPPAALSIQEELPENRSHLSPLAARAALASLMSTNHGHITMDGTKMFISSVFNNMPTKDKVPSEISDDSIPVISDADEMVIPLISTKSKPQQGNKKGNRVSKLTNSGVTLKCLPREGNVNQPNKAARITRSAVWEGTVIQNDNVQINICSEDMKLRATTNKRRLTRAAVNEERENLVMEVKQALEAKKSSLTTESDFLEGSFSVPRSNVSKKSNDISTEKKAKSSPVTNKRRLTRSAVNEETENLVMEVKQALEAKKSSGITESGSLEESFSILGSNVSKKSSDASTKKKSISSLITNKRRLTRSAVNEERENLVMEVKQALQAKKSSGITESDSLEGSFSIPGSNVSKKGSGVSIEKKSISSSITNKRRLTRSVVNEERKNLVMEVKQALEAKKSSGITESDSLEGSFSIPGSNVSKKSSGVSTKKKSISSPITNKRRLTRSAINEERENLVMEVEQALEAKKSSRITESDSLEGSFSVPRSIVSKKSSGVLIEKKAISSLVTNKRRLTRSAVNEERENLVMEVKQALEAKKSSHITESNSPKRSFSVPKSNVSEKSSGVSTEKKAISSPVTNTRRLTRSAVNEEREILVMEVKQALEAKKSSRITELDSLEGSFSVPESNVSQKSSGVSIEKKAISSPVDAEISIPIEERNKKQMPCAVKTTQQSEGKVSGVSQGQKRKSTSSQKQEQRFSPRLKFLPRTRSQNKS